MRACAFVCGMICFFSAAEPALYGDPGNETTTDRVARLTEQLGDNSFVKRETASRELEAIGEPALDSLHRAASLGDEEIRSRADRIIHLIAARAQRAELARWAGSWKSSDGTWLKITGDRWSSGTPTFGPVAGGMWVSEIREKMVFADFAVEEGPTKGLFVKGIFRLDGDSLHYCATYTGNYPTEFKTVGTCYACVLKRVKN